MWLDPAEWATPLLVFNISTHTVGGHRRVRCFGTTALRLLPFSDTHPGQRGEPRTPGLWGRTPTFLMAQPRAWWFNGVGEGEGENREWTLMDAKGGTPMRTGVDSFAVPTDGMFPPRQRRTMRQPRPPARVEVIIMEQEGCRPGISVPAMNTGQDIGAEARFRGMES